MFTHEKNRLYNILFHNYNWKHIFLAHIPILSTLHIPVLTTLHYNYNSVLEKMLQNHEFWKQFTFLVVEVQCLLSWIWPLEGGVIVLINPAGQICRSPFNNCDILCKWKLPLATWGGMGGKQKEEKEEKTKDFSCRTEFIATTSHRWQCKLYSSRSIIQKTEEKNR